MERASAGSTFTSKRSMGMMIGCSGTGKNFRPLVEEGKRQRSQDVTRRLKTAPGWFGSEANLELELVPHGQQRLGVVDGMVGVGGLAQVFEVLERVPDDALVATSTIT